MKQAPIFIIALTLAAGAGNQACSRGERAHGGPEANTDATTPAGTTSASAERQIVTLTGCLKRDVQPGTYALISVATAGVLDDGKSSQSQQQGRDTKSQDTAAQSGRARTDTATPGSAASLASGSSYRLIPAKDDQRQEMAKYENQRVAVRGRLAADAPVGTSGTGGSPAGSGTGSGGTVIDSSATNATVAGSAPSLRGLHVESVRKVGDSCQ